MQIKALVVALVGVTAVADASALHRRHDVLVSRQNKFGGGPGGFGGGGQGQGQASGQGKGQNQQGNAQQGQANAAQQGQNNNAQQGQNNNAKQGNNNAANQGNNNANQGNNDANNNALCLQSANLQSASASTGQSGGTVEAGQVNSETDKANFINFCSGKTITNGAQVTTGSCNGIVMGDIPAKSSMVSSIITNPASGDTIDANKSFNVTVKIANMQLGSFTNAQNTYYSAPQQLSNGKVIGHTHVTIQDMGNSMNPQSPLDASQFAFFKGINDAGNGQGTLTTAVTDGLPAGNYRVCSMAGASNHQPVLMPVAQRGASDDCIRFQVGNGNGGNNNNNNNGGNNAKQGQNANAGNANQGQNANAGNAGNANQGQNGNGQTANAGNAKQGQNQGNSQASSSSSAKSSTSTAQAGARNGNSGTKATAAASATAKSNGSKPSTAAAATGSSKGASGRTGGGNNNSAGVGGIAAPAVTNSGDSSRPFAVNGNTFVNEAAAVQRACAIQNNACADAVNSGKAQGSTVADCNAQEQACNQAGGTR